MLLGSIHWSFLQQKTVVRKCHRLTCYVCAAFENLYKFVLDAQTHRQAMSGELEDNGIAPNLYILLALL